MNWKIIAKIAFVVGVTGLAWVSVPLAIIAICAAVLVALHDKASSLVEFSFGPLKAKLERNVSDSEELLSGLKNLALAQSRALVSASAHTGRFATDDAWIFHAAKDLEASLRAIGMSESELADSRSALVKLTMRDLGAAATNGSSLPSRLGDEAVSEWRAFRRTDQLSDPDFVQTWLEKHRAYGPKQKVVIEAMRWIAEHQDIRDADQYLLAKGQYDLEQRTEAVL